MTKKRKYILRMPSTRFFFQEGRKTEGYSFFDWIHGYIYARWPYLYIGVATGEHRLSRFLSGFWERIAGIFSRSSDGDSCSAAESFAHGYHGKVVPLEEACELVSIDQEVSLKNLEQIIPYDRARDIIMKNPDHIVVLDCPCRASRPEPCRPLDVCLIIGEPFAGFVAEHHPQRSRWINRDEAVEILNAEQKRGHVHHAFFKDAMLGRFYAICNCCSCCCGAMQSWANGIPMLASSGYVSRIQSDSCIGCGTCAEFCQFKALKPENGRMTVEESRCMGCGVCVSKCATGAIKLERDESRGEPLRIRQLIEKSAGMS
jgi:ferredoxin